MQCNADELPRFLIPMRPPEVPADLAALPRNARVHYTDPPMCGRTGEGIASAGDLVDVIQAMISRQADGWVTLEEAAQHLENTGCGSARGRGGWKEKLCTAARSGELPMHEPGTLARRVYAADRPVREWHEWAHEDDLDRWLADHEPRLPYRFNTGAAPESTDPQPESAEQRQERRYRMCTDAGLTLPTDDYVHLPRGIGALAKKAGISRQAFSEDVKEHIRRLNGR